MKKIKETLVQHIQAPGSSELLLIITVAFCILTIVVIAI